ncbi:hypothetical protein [Massilia niastensis]|uniref:hypothetical protein n=1 Tax=Massilia niastensis TaxID=544911 RepID=UPI00036C20CA|nr:hypothetical protein [Massilia niastensis]
MIQHFTWRTLAAGACALLLSACGGSDSSPDRNLGGGKGSSTPPPPVVEPPVVTRVDLLSSTARGMESVVFNAGSAYVSYSNSATEGSAIMKATLPLAAASTWTPVAQGGCALGPVGDYIVRAPKLKMVGDTLWMMQPWAERPEPAAQEHSTCILAPQASAFVARDAGLRFCNQYFCETLSMQDIKARGNRLYSNAGAGVNLLSSGDQGATWKAMRGDLASMVCTHTKFEFVGDRVLVGGECPLDDAFIEAYQLNADGAALASAEPLPLTMPELENRNIQFITAIPNTQRVFVGVEGGLLRSEDNGRSFTFVIQHPLSENLAYPYIGSLIALNGKPDTMVIGGFDKKNHRPYMAWSKDGGATWTDVSKLLPAYDKPQTGDFKAGIVTSIAEDPQGRILFTINENEDQQGRLMQLTLGSN